MIELCCKDNNWLRGGDRKAVQPHVATRAGPFIGTALVSAGPLPLQWEPTGQLAAVAGAWQHGRNRAWRPRRHWEARPVHPER
jgi:hypothetical protein